MRFTRLSHQILVVFVAVVVLALGVSGWAVTTLAQRIVTDNIARGHQELARRIAEEIELEMEDIRPILSLLTELATVRTMEPAGVVTELARYQARFPAITAAYVADLAGQQIARTDGEPLENVATIYGFQVAREGHELFSDVYLQPSGQGPMLTAYLPIADSSEVVGVLVADVNFDRVQDILEGLVLTRNGTAVIFALNGRVVAHSHMAELAEPPALTDLMLIETLVRGPAGVVEGYRDELGRTVVGVHAPVNELGWGVVIQTPVGELAAEVVTLRRTMAMGLLGGIALAVVAGWLMASRLAEPIGQLAQATERVAAGDLATTVEVSASNEVGMLATSFNRMVASLKESRDKIEQLYAEVKQLNVGLEQQINLATEEIRRRADGLARLYEVGKKITSTLELDTMLQTIADEAVQVVGANKSLILLIDAAEEKLVQAVGHGYSRAELNGHTFEEFQDGISGWVLQKKIPTLSADIQTDERNRGKALASARRSRDRSVAVAPLLIGDEVIGTLTVVNSQEERAFTPADLNLVTMLAGQAAIAIHNARLYETAQEADRVKSAFLATMSHELRTPLNSIIGFTGIILQGLAGPLNDEQTKQLGMVQSSARHLLNLINDVLDISKIEAGQVEIVSEPFDIRQAIEKAVRTMTPLAEKKGLALVAEVAPEVGQIVSDRRRVEQILMNLLSNAVKFTDVGEVRIACQVDDGWLVTRVVDTGMGIKPEDMGKLFQPFRQIETGLARRHEGTGLGLSICKRLVDMLGGEIWAESEWGVGSTFTFTLPVKIGGGDEI